MTEVITSQSQPERYQQLLALWNTEHRPGWLVVSGKTYQVLIKESGPEFILTNAEGLYESTSLH